MSAANPWGTPTNGASPSGPAYAPPMNGQPPSNMSANAPQQPMPPQAQMQQAPQQMPVPPAQPQQPQMNGPQQPADPTKAPRAAAVILFVLAAVADLVMLFAPHQMWKDTVEVVGTAVAVVVSLIAATMLRTPVNSRAFGVGFGLGVAIVNTGRYFVTFDPNLFNGEPGAIQLSGVGSYAATALAGIAVLVLMAKERPLTERVRQAPLLPMLLVVPAAVLWLVGDIFRDFTWNADGHELDAQCCNFSQYDGFNQTSKVATLGVLLLIGFLAAMSSRARESRGLLLGAGAVLLTEWLTDCMAFVSPAEAMNGTYVSGNPAQLSAQATPFFWVATAGMVLLLATGLIQGPGKPTLDAQGPGVPGAVAFPGAAPGFVPQQQQDQALTQLVQQQPLQQPQPQIPQQMSPQQAQPQQQPQIPQQMQPPMGPAPSAQPGTPQAQGGQ